MSFINFLSLLFLSLLLASCSSRDVFTKDDDLVVNELCGGGYKKSNPCYYVKELNFHLNGVLYEKESLNFFNKYMTEKVEEINKNFSHSNVKANFKPFSGGTWGYIQKERDSSIDITLLFTKAPDKKYTIITFYTFSKWTYYINTTQCPSNDNDCIVDKIRSFVDEIVIKSITQDGN